MDLAVIVLAAGRGAHPRAVLPSAMHPLAGRPMVCFVTDAARTLEPTELVIVGEDAEQVRQAVGVETKHLIQPTEEGAAYAVLQAKEAVANRSETVLVLNGCMPLVHATALHKMVLHHRAEGAAMTGFSSKEQAANQVRDGILCFRDDWLWPNLARLHSQTGDEPRLIDLRALALKQGETVATLPVPDPLEVMEVDDQLKLAQAEAEMRRRINEQWMRSGVILIHPEATYIEADVQIGADTVIWPNTFLQGQTRIGQGCTIGPGSVIRDSTIGDGCRVELSVVEQAIMEEGSDVGPFGHLRKGAHLGPGAHMGNFGEVKNSYLGPGVKMGHFSYLGDATVGAGANIGAGTITCNFDGQRKHHTLIGQGAFIGSDTMLVAPVEIGDGARTGAGSVVTRDVPPGSVAYGVPARLKSEPGRDDSEEE